MPRRVGGLHTEWERARVKQGLLRKEDFHSSRYSTDVGSPHSSTTSAIRATVSASLPKTSQHKNTTIWVGGFGMTPWCDDLVCSWRRLLADRHSLPFPWTLSLHRRWCPSASHHPLTFLFLLALTFPLPSPFPSLGLSLRRPQCPSASPHSFRSHSLGR